MKVAVYTHASHAIGMGHLYRVRNLLDELRQREPATRLMLLVNDDPLPAQFFGAQYDDVISGNPVHFKTWASDALSVFGPDVALHDALDASAQVLRTLRDNADILISIDDVSDVARELCDLRINVLYQTPSLPTDPPTWNDLGAVFLHRRFAEAARSYTYRVQAHSVLVSQGGADTFGCVPKIVESLRDIPGVILHVVTGMAFQHQRELQRACEDHDHIVIYDNVEDMAALMLTCDVAVSGGGMTLFELAAVGLPTLTLTAEPRELETIERFSSSGTVIDFGLTEPFPGDALEHTVADLLTNRDLRQSLGQRAHSAVDGNGIRRVIDFMLEANANKCTREK